MKYTYAYRTDMGNSRKSNQDALLIKTLRIEEKDALLLAVCDGLGGLSQGEKMSHWAASMLSDWFDREFPQLALGEEEDPPGTPGERIKHRLSQLLENINSFLFYNNQRNGISGGTTLSMILFWDNMRYIMHIGDSRIYEVTGGSVRRLTTDHSFVAREVRMGRMSEEEAKTSPKQNILLQCLGPAPALQSPELYCELTGSSAGYVLCTDGFWHSIEDNDLLERFAPENADKASLGDSIAFLMERAKARGEMDNITAVAAIVSCAQAA